MLQSHVPLCLSVLVKGSLVTENAWILLGCCDIFAVQLFSNSSSKKNAGTYFRQWMSYYTPCGDEVQDQGWWLFSQFSWFRDFAIFFNWSKHCLPVWYQVHTCNASPQLKSSNIYFCWINCSRSREINKRSFSTPTQMSDAAFDSTAQLYNGYVTW